MSGRPWWMIEFFVPGASPLEGWPFSCDRSDDDSRGDVVGVDCSELPSGESGRVTNSCVSRLIPALRARLAQSSRIDPSQRAWPEAKGAVSEAAAKRQGSPLTEVVDRPDELDGLCGARVRFSRLHNLTEDRRDVGDARPAGDEEDRGGLGGVRRGTVRPLRADGEQAGLLSRLGGEARDVARERFGDSVVDAKDKVEVAIRSGLAGD